MNSIHFPFFFITETHLKSCHNDAEVKIANYSPFRADRDSRLKGGAAIYLHNSLVADQDMSFSNGHCELVILHNKKSNIILSSFYRSPNSPTHLFVECIQKLQRFIDNIIGEAELLITGDFNFPFIDWNTSEIKPCSNITPSERSSAMSFLLFIESNLLIQMVNEPTRHDKNTLDLILSNNSDNIHDISVNKTEISDHDFINCSLLHPELLKHRVEVPPFIPQAPLANINFSKADWDSIRKHFQLVDWTAVLDPDIDQNTAWELFDAAVVKACELYAPLHTAAIKTQSAVRVPKSRQILLRKKHRLNTRINAAKRSLDQSTDQCKILLANLNKQRASIEILIKEDIQNQRFLEESRALEKIKSNPKAFYAFAKRSSVYKPPVGPLKDSEGVLQSDPVIMGSILQNQYARAFSDPDKANLRLFQHYIHEKIPKEIIEDIEFSVDDIIVAIDKLSISSAGGPDMFPAVILKECKLELAPILYRLWRLSFDSGDIAE